ncbi:MAG: hydroxymethylglutaryl-CoA lyase [Phycisphaerales bacterium]|nr:hydroxymethylglutaryl-CoA lyase [Phycisphaerales bacterium]
MKNVRVIDVAPRDGLQNEAGVIALDEKAKLVRLLTLSGIDEVEVTSFVSPKWVPQLADARALCDVLANDPPKPAGVIYSVLIPNEKGMEQAVEVNERAGRRVLDKVSVFTAASQTFSRKNTNASIEETIERFRSVVARAKASSLLVRGYVSCAIACPFEGAIKPREVADVARRLADLGVDEISLGDTIGAGTPGTVVDMLDAVRATLPGEWTSGAFGINLHLHDTFGRAADCVVAALGAGIRSFDGSVAGLGGCPYASTPGKRAPGNIDTTLLIRTIRDCGFSTHASVDMLAAAAAVARSMVSAARSSSL